MSDSSAPQTRSPDALIVLVIIAISGATYLPYYWLPAAPFWDENYHIPSAFKYLYHVFFMEPHPPLGKMLLALGEWLVSPNNAIDPRPLLESHHVGELPATFSFAGVRLIPTIAGWLTAPLLYLICRRALLSQYSAVAASALYAFDNAIIAHSRAAMLDSMQLFFVCLTVLTLLSPSLNTPTTWWRRSLIVGGLIGAAIAVKLNALMLVATFFAWTLWMIHSNGDLSRGARVRSGLEASIAAALASLMVFYGSWYLHIRQGRSVVAENWYEASPWLKDAVKRGEQSDLRNFPAMLREHLQFGPLYHSRVPSLQDENPHENGSAPYLWPFGVRTINYRWEKSGDGLIQSLTLIANPVTWTLGLGALLMSLALVPRLIIEAVQQHSQKAWMYLMILVSYLAYMAGMIAIDRVLYLYHYLLPLTLSYLLAAFVIDRFESRFVTLSTRAKITVSLMPLGLIISCYLFFAPFTYYWKITSEQCNARGWVAAWRVLCP